MKAPAQSARVAVTLATLVLFAAAAQAGSVTMGFTAPSNQKAETVKVTITYPNGQSWTMPVTIPNPCTATEKRNRIKETIDAHVQPDWTVTSDPNSPSLTIKDLPAGAKVAFDAGKTGEVSDSIVVPKVGFGATAYSGTFAPFGYDGLPAVFVAGVRTDLGELTAIVSAEELNFQTAGPIICEALFQRLAPFTPPLGAFVNYAGDRLEVYFDPAYCTGPSGVIFGTSSPSEGCTGEVLVTEGPDCNGNGVPDEIDIASGYSLDLNGNLVPDECEGPTECLGDANCDGTVSWRDIDYFVAALNNNVPAWTAMFLPDLPTCPFSNNDANLDGSVTWRDIDPFIGLLNTTCR